MKSNSLLPSEPRVGIHMGRGARTTQIVGYEPEEITYAICNAVSSWSGKQSWKKTPFETFIPYGSRVLIKPNWVLHHNEAGMGMDCLTTNIVFIECVMREVANAGAVEIIVGDSPIQLCHWDKLVNPSWCREIAESLCCPVRFVDFRRIVWNGNSFVTNNREIENFVHFDLEGKSLLEPITALGKSEFRITNYAPKSLTRTHYKGHHEYVLCKEAFTSDVVLSLPKLKTHAKAGLTGALKNLVGLNGNKDYLPHHRVGGAQTGGDNYKGVEPLKRCAEWCLDRGNRKISSLSHRIWQSIAYGVFLKSQKLLGRDANIDGRWHGNDTVWRMCLDLVRLLHYAKSDGTISSSPQRKLYSLTDAWIAGQGEGPLAPEPANMFAVTFGDSAAHIDRVHASMMGFDWNSIHIIREAFEIEEFPIVRASADDVSIVLNEGEIDMKELQNLFPFKFKSPEGWREVLC